jgi:hypothetical protein
MLAARVERQGLDEVARDFGDGFAAALQTLPRGQWSGLAESGLGVHLVRVDAWAPAVTPPLDQVRAQVQRERPASASRLTRINAVRFIPTVWGPGILGPRTRLPRPVRCSVRRGVPLVGAGELQ